MTITKDIQMFPNRLQMMQALITPGMVGAEVGVYRGDFAHSLLTKTKLGRLFLIDCWCRQTGAYELDSKNNEDLAECLRVTREKVLRFIDSGEAEIIVGYSNQVASTWPTSEYPQELDFVYIDADHSYEACLADLRAWAPFIKRSGFIAGHDYVDSTPAAKAMNFGVIKAVTQFCAETDWKLTCLTQEADWPSYALTRP